MTDLPDDIEIKALDLEVSVGPDDTQRGLKVGLDGEAFWRVHITPQGEVLVGDGMSPPEPLSGGGGGGGDVATDAIWDAAGDLVVGSGANTAVKLPKGTDGHFLKAGAATLAWAGIVAADIADLTTVVQALIDASIDSVLDGAPAALDTLNELSAALGDDADFAATMTTALAGKQAASAHLTTIAAAANSAVLAATTASFTTADETKLDGIEALADVTDAANVNAAGAVMESDYNDNTILAATADNTPVPLTVAASRILGRKATGDIGALTLAEVVALGGTPDGTKFLRDDGTLVTPAGGGGTVDVVSNVAADRVLGRLTSGSGDSEELTAAQVRSLIKSPVELSYVERTTSMSPTQTAEASAETVVTAAALSLDGSTRVRIEFYTPFARSANTTAATINFYLFDGSTSLGRIAVIGTPANNTTYAPVHVDRFLTPSNASHTFSIRVTVSGGTGAVAGGAGGSGVDAPAYIRVTTAPQ